MERLGAKLHRNVDELRRNENSNLARDPAYEPFGSMTLNGSHYRTPGTVNVTRFGDWSLEAHHM